MHVAVRRINYIYLFDMDPRAISSSLVVFNNVALETALYLVTLLLYYKVCSITTRSYHDVLGQELTS